MKTSAVVNRMYPKNERPLVESHSSWNGDDWEIAVTRMADTKSDEIACLETRGTNAMDDIGGVWGLAEFTELLAKCTIKSEDEITEGTDFRISEWGYYDPAEREAFLRGPTLEELTQRLKGVVRARQADAEAERRSPQRGGEGT